MREGFGDFHHLLLGYGQASAGDSDVERGAELFQQRFNFGELLGAGRANARDGVRAPEKCYQPR